MTTTNENAQATSPNPLRGARHIKDAAKAAGVPYTWLRGHIKAKNIPSLRIGGRIMVSPQVVLERIDDWANGDGEPDITRAENTSEVLGSEDDE